MPEKAAWEDRFSSQSTVKVEKINICLFWTRISLLRMSTNVHIYYGGSQNKQYFFLFSYYNSVLWLWQHFNSGIHGSPPLPSNDQTATLTHTMIPPCVPQESSIIFFIFGFSREAVWGSLTGKSQKSPKGDLGICTAEPSTGWWRFRVSE